MSDLTFEQRIKIRQLEKERATFLAEHPELQWLQDAIDRDNKLIGDDYVGRIKVLFQRIGGHCRLLGKEIDALTQTTHHLRGMLRSFAGRIDGTDRSVEGDNGTELPKVDGDIEELVENTTKGLENMMKMGLLENKGSIFIPED